ncbi:hypothetical protein IAG44_23570 [Streptomyces roseirectus]|uniref:Uncharacterized protein n=1 Tax=Streptomyces roseirectus TaxID=2768066 RepID=A0A7H0IH33_9ACTN|nr:hypothetical protein [Streptomyces roseirectus]QNP72099.1 hypothetical protein IAG44_23570 [Streptomyces roseirectus]
MAGDVRSSVEGGEFHGPVVQAGDIGSVVVHPPRRVRKRHLALGAAFLAALTLTGVYLSRGGQEETRLGANVETTAWKCEDSAVVPGLRIGADGMAPMQEFPKGGIRASGKLSVVLQGSGEEELTLTGARVRIVARRPPAHGTHIVNPCGSEVSPRVFDLDLDRPAPRLVPAEVTGGPPEEKGSRPISDWPYAVKRGDSEYLVIQPRSRRYDTEFRILLDWTTGARKGVLTLDDHGRPFRVTATTAADPTCVAGRPDRETFYWLMPANSPLCPKS